MPGSGTTCRAFVALFASSRIAFSCNERAFSITAWPGSEKKTVCKIQPETRLGQPPDLFQIHAVHCGRGDSPRSA